MQGTTPGSRSRGRPKTARMSTRPTLQTTLRLKIRKSMAIFFSDSLHQPVPLYQCINYIVYRSISDRQTIHRCHTVATCKFACVQTTHQLTDTYQTGHRQTDRETPGKTQTLYYVDPIITIDVKNLPFLANVNSSSCSLYVIGRPSVCLSSVCNVRAPYSGD